MPRTRELDFQLFNVRLPAGTVERLQRYRDHLNPTLPNLLKFMGYGTVSERTEGMTLTDVEGEEWP